MRISDWSSDVCSSDLIARHVVIAPAGPETAPQEGVAIAIDIAAPAAPGDDHGAIEAAAVKAAVPGIAEAGARHDAFAALVDAIVHADDQIGRSEERRVGKECVGTGRYGWSPHH